MLDNIMTSIHTDNSEVIRLAEIKIESLTTEIKQLRAERTEFICKKCYLRQDNPNQKKASF